MDAILNAIAGALTKADNIGLVVSVLFNVGLGWAHVKFRAEDRLDRMENAAALKELAEALNNMRNFLSAQTGKVVQ